MEHRLHSPVQLQHGLKVLLTLPEHSPYPQQLCPQEVFFFFFSTVSFFFCLSQKHPCRDPWSIPKNDSCTWKYTAGEINADPCPIPQKASTSSSSHPLLLGLAPGVFHRINFSYKGILYYIDFFV